MSSGTTGALYSLISHGFWGLAILFVIIFIIYKILKDD